MEGLCKCYCRIRIFTSLSEILRSLQLRFKDFRICLLFQIMSGLAFRAAVCLFSTAFPRVLFVTFSSNCMTFQSTLLEINVILYWLLYPCTSEALVQRTLVVRQITYSFIDDET